MHPCCSVKFRLDDESLCVCMAKQLLFLGIDQYSFFGADTNISMHNIVVQGACHNSQTYPWNLDVPLLQC